MTDRSFGFDVHYWREGTPGVSTGWVYSQAYHTEGEAMVSALSNATANPPRQWRIVDPQYITLWTFTRQDDGTVVAAYNKAKAFGFGDT